MTDPEPTVPHLLGELERKELRLRIGNSILDAQAAFRSRGPAVMIPEIIAALMSLAVRIAKHNANLDRAAWDEACAQAAREQWPEDPEEQFPDHRLEDRRDE
jgi:hypothetical protein